MRYYSASFKNNLVWMYNEKTSDSKANDALESDEKELKTAFDKLCEEINAIEGVKKAELSEGGHVVGIEAADEDYPQIMNKVVNLYRKLDDSSVVSYDFQLNMQ